MALKIFNIKSQTVSETVSKFCTKSSSGIELSDSGKKFNKKLPLGKVTEKSGGLGAAASDGDEILKTKVNLH